MYNVLKMDLFRLLKSRSFLIIFFIIALFIITNVNDINYVIKHPEIAKKEQQMENDNKDSVDFGLTSDRNFINDRTITLQNIAAMPINSSIVLMLTSILAVIFVSAETSSGFVKNIINCIKRRWYSVISKVIVMAVVIFLEFISVLLISALASSVFLNDFKITINGDLIKYMGLQYLLHVAFISFVILITILLKNAAISMAINILLCMGFTALIGYLRFGDFRFGEFLMKHLNSLNIKSLPGIIDSNTFIKIIVSSIVTFIIYNIISCMIIEKRDIK